MYFSFLFQVTNVYSNAASSGMILIIPSKVKILAKVYRTKNKYKKNL